MGPDWIQRGALLAAGRFTVRPACHLAPRFNVTGATPRQAFLRQPVLDILWASRRAFIADQRLLARLPAIPRVQHARRFVVCRWRGSGRSGGGLISSGWTRAGDARRSCWIARLRGTTAGPKTADAPSRHRRRRRRRRIRSACHLPFQEDPGAEKGITCRNAGRIAPYGGILSHGITAAAPRAHDAIVSRRFAVLPYGRSASWMVDFSTGQKPVWTAASVHGRATVPRRLLLLHGLPTADVAWPMD